jgi:hypothetical protein
MSNQSNNVWKFLGLGCGIPASIAVILVFGLIVYFSFGPEGGVRLSNNIEDYAIKYIEEKNLLDASERVVAYYDASTSLNGSEAAILTNSRILYHHQGRNHEIKLVDVKDISHESDGLGGDRIVIYSNSGDSMVIEIYIFNNGKLFLKALQNQLEFVRGKTSEKVDGFRSLCLVSVSC